MLGLDLMHMCSGSAPFVVASSVSSFLLMPRRKILLGHYDSFCREYLGPNFSVKYARTAASVRHLNRYTMSRILPPHSLMHFSIGCDDIMVRLYFDRFMTSCLVGSLSSLGWDGHVWQPVHGYGAY